MAITEFLSLEKPAKTDRINVDVLNDNTDEIDKQFKRNSIVLSETGKNISVSATGPYYTVTNNNADTVQVLLEGNSMLLDPGETFKMNKDATETFTLEVTCASDVTVAYFKRNKDYVDGSLASNLTNYYDKTDSDGRFLQILDFGAAVNEESSSVCSEVLPLKYTAYGNNIEQYRIYGDTPQQVGAISPAFPKTVYGAGNLVTDSQSEHYGEYALPIINNGVTYNAYLTSPLYRVNFESDYVDYARQKVVRNVGIIMYDGSTDEEWANTEYQKYRIALENLGGGTDASYPYDVLCDKLTKTSASGVGIWDDRIAICDGYVYVHFDDTMTDVTTFKAYLQSNPITVYYPLASEVTEDVTLPDILTISGENQLYVDTTELPKNVVVGAAMQYFSPREMYESFPSKDDFWTKSESEKYTTAEKNKLAAITNPIKLKGRVDSISYLPAVAEIGWLYFVGTESTVDKEEYVYTEDGTWEHIGTAEVDLSSYYTKAECNDAFADTTHTHNYAASDSAGGAATSAKRLDNMTAIGSVTQPVYFNADGVPIPTSYTVEKSVPSNAVFTDTTYNLATTSANGLMSSTDKKKINIAEPQFAYCTADVSSTGYYKITINNASAWMMSFDVRIYHWYHCYNLCVSGYNYGENHWSSPKAITTSSTSPVTKYTPVTFGYNSDGKLWFAVPAAPYTGILINGINQGMTAPITDFSGLFTVEKVTELTGTTQATVNAYRPVYANEGLVVTTVPTSATATGIKGDIAYDANYMYVCTDTNVWKRTALTTW